MTGRASPSRLRRALGWIGRVLAGVAVLVVACVAGLVIYLDTPSARRLAVRELNILLQGRFKGGVTFENVSALRINGVSGIEFYVEAPDGTRVLVAHGVRLRIAPLALLRSALRGGGDMRVDVFDADVQSLEVNLDTDHDGVPKIEAAFEPSGPSSPAASGGRVVRLEFPSLTLQHAWVHGQMNGAPPIDADLDGLRGSLRIAPHDTAIALSHVALASRGMPHGANPRGALEGHLTIPSKTGKGLGVDASFEGDVGGIPATARASMVGDRLDADVDVPEVAAEKIRALVAQAPVYRAVAAHVEAHGLLSQLHTTARATVGAGHIDVDGDLSLVGKFAAAIRVEVRSLDLRAFSLTAPASNLALGADIRIDTKVDGTLAGNFAAAVSGGTVGDQAVPAAVFQGDLEQEQSADGFEIKARGTVAEPGAPVAFRVDVRTHAPAPVVEFDASSAIARLADVKRLGGLGSGRAHIQIAGLVTLSASPSIDATLEADVDSFQHGVVGADRAKLVATTSGAFADPTVGATLDASVIRIDKYSFRTAQVTTQGTLSGLDVTAALRGDASRADARAKLRLGAAGVAVEGALLDLSRGTQTLHATVDRVRSQSGRFDVEGLSVTGLGEPARADVHVQGGSVAARAESRGLDLGALGRVLSLDHELRRGRLAFAVDLSARPDGADGIATAELDDGCFGGVDGLSGHLETRLDGRTLTGAMRAAASGLGTMSVSDVRLHVGGRGPLELASWRRAWGELNLEGKVDLAKVEDMLSPNALPVARVSGQLIVKGHVARDSEADETPDVALSLVTSGLRVAPRGGPDDKSHGMIVVGPPPWSVAGMDVQIDASVQGDDGFAEVAVRIVDGQGTLLALDAKSDAIPFGALMASSAGAGERMMRVPFRALVSVPQRKLASLPDVLRLNGGSGEVQATMSIDGTCLHPTVDLRAKAHSIKFDASPLLRPLDADLTGTYDGTKSDVALDVRSPAANLVHVVAHANARVEELVAGTSAWDASADAVLTRFSLASIAALSDRSLRGHVSGRIHLTGFHDDARGSVDLNLEDLRIGETQYGGGRIKMAFDGQALDANVRLDQSGGFALANANMAMSWGARMAPSLNPSGSTRASFQAKNFRAGFLAPFVQGTIEQLDGRIDGQARMSFVPNQKPELDGSLEFSQGLVGLTALGQELRAVKLKATFTRDGVVRIEDMSASGTSGKLTAAAVARFDGTTFVAADAQLKIDKRDAMPLAVQGTDIGTVYGQLLLKATRATDRSTMNLNIDVPSWHVELPQASTHSVQELGERPPQIRVGVYVSPRRFLKLPVDADDLTTPEEGVAETQPGNALTVGVRVGEDVEIKRGTDVKVRLTGDVTAGLGQETTVKGQIRLAGGKLDVQGKTFVIQTGVVTFLGDPSNPEVRATAGWTAEDGTRVYADYVGPLKTGKVTLRSEPPRSQNEILALIMFGTADGSSATPAGSQPDAAVKAGTTAGGFATAGLNKELDKLTGVDITAKIDTSHASPRPEVEVQIAKNISLQIAYVLGIPPPGTNQDTTYATIDWRFMRSWLLETTFGNLGSSIANVVWRHRY